MKRELISIHDYPTNGDLFDSDAERMAARINERVGYETRKIGRLDDNRWLVERKSYPRSVAQSLVLDDHILWADLILTGEAIGLW